MDNTPQEVPEESPLDALNKLAEAAKLQRLAPAEEDHAVSLLLPILTSGKGGISSVLETIVALPWIISVNAVSAAWPEWTPIMRRHLLTGLSKIKTDQALRLRLSLARAIFKIDPPTALKIAAGTLPDLLDEATGTLTPKHRQIFFNVLIGKGKPWLLQLPLAEFKPSEADTIVHCAIETFPFCPPLSQFSILRWTHAGGRFKKINETDLATIVRSVGRWNGKLQRQLKAEIEDLPEALTAVFKPAPAPRPEEKKPQVEISTPEAEPLLLPPSQGQPVAETTEAPSEGQAEAAPETTGEETAEGRPPEAPPAESRSRRKEREREERRNKRDRKRERRESRRPAPSEEAEELAEDEEDLTEEIVELEAIDGVSKERGEALEETRELPESEEESRDTTRSRDRRSGREREERREERRGERADRVSDRPIDRGRQKAPFDFKESLRGLETYVSSLRNELEQTKTQLRRKEEEVSRRGGDRRRGEERFPVDVEDLQKHNAQLEQTVADLRQQLEDLTTHHEAVAESRELHGTEPLPEGSVEQLRKLLSIKLQEDYEIYTAMRLEPLDRVFRLDYRDLLGQVFDVLIEQGVVLKPTTPKRG